MVADKIILLFSPDPVQCFRKYDTSVTREVKRVRGNELASSSSQLRTRKVGFTDAEDSTLALELDLSNNYRIRYLIR